MLHNYPRIYAIGHLTIERLFEGPVVVQEKVDGSQFSFGVWEGVLYIRSKGAVIDPEAPPKMFAPAVETVWGLMGDGRLEEGWTYRGEVLTKPKHNTLAYERTPKGFIILFDTDSGREAYFSPEMVRGVAERLELESVPTLYEGTVDSWEFLKQFLDHESTLGGAKIEGVVVKNYARVTLDDTIAMGKFVSEVFKETHGTPKVRGGGRSDVVEELVAQLRTDARWEKAVQHLRDANQLTNSPKDIGLLIREVATDVLLEHGDEIKEALFKHLWKDVSRGVTEGFAEWYKERLAASAFEGAEGE